MAGNGYNEYFKNRLARLSRQHSHGRMPQFLIVGAAKAGTTALYHYLRQHPQIFIPAHQEPSFFSFEGRRPDFRGPGGSEAAVNRTAVTSLEHYLSLYRSAEPGMLLCDVSPTYLYWPEAPERILHHSPDAKIYAILRNPVDRAYSSYMHAVREGKEPLELQAALEAEPRRIAENWGFLWRYTDMGRYSIQLQRYYDTFPGHNIKVVWYDDLAADTVAVYRELVEFAGVDPSFVPDVSLRHNLSGVPKSRYVHQLLTRGGPLRRLVRELVPAIGQEPLQRWRVQLRNRNLARPSMPTEVRAHLVETFCEEVRALERLTGRDLGHWRQM